jgi:hypothetical protein
MVLLFVYAMPTLAASAFLSGYTPYGIKSITDSKKAWTVRFSTPVDNTTVKKPTGVFLTDDRNIAVSADITVSEDGYTVTVVPKTAYTPGKEYRLYVGKAVKGKNKKVLSTAVVQPFFLTEATGENYAEQITSTGYIVLTTPVVDIRVKAKSTVSRVTVDGKDMKYVAENEFRLNVPNVKTGDTVKIELYDLRNQKVQTIAHTVQ